VIGAMSPLMPALLRGQFVLQADEVQIGVPE
jgi:hypothetical protein